MAAKFPFPGKAPAAGVSARPGGKAVPSATAARPQPPPGDAADAATDLTHPKPAATPVANPKGPKLGADGKVDKTALIEQYRPFVRSIAGKIKKTLSKEIEFDDLLEFGMIGLLEAGDRFDPKFGANFMTFSYYRVRGAIYDGLRQMGWVNRNEYAKLRFEERANAYLQNMADRQAGTSGDTTKTSQDELNELAQQVSNLVTIYVTSLEAMEGLQVEDKETVAVDIRLADIQMKQHVRAALELMPEQEKKLITLYYFGEMSLQEVGAQLGLSKSWTSRLHAKAIEKLAEVLRGLTQDGAGQPPAPAPSGRPHQRSSKVGDAPTPRSPGKP